MARIVPDVLVPLLQPSEEDPRPVVVMMCGIAGSGKSTLAKSIITEFPNFARLSIDQIIYESHGMHSVDYPAALYEQYQLEADAKYVPEFRRLLATIPATNVVLDRSFYAREDRDEFRQWAQDGGARCVLVYFDATREVLWRRIKQREAAGRNADSALDITEEILDGYLGGFDYPNGEGEIVIHVT